MSTATAEATSDAPAPREEPAGIRGGIRYCVRVFLAVRVGLFVLGLVAVAVIPSKKPVSVPGWPAHPMPGAGWHNVFTAWERFDALWFLRIAASGYRSNDGSAAFFPLYPLAIRAASFLLGGHPFAAGMLVSNLSFLGALIVLYFLTASELSEEAARTTILLLCLFPSSFFFFMPYSESLFLLLAVTSFWAARRDRWALAALSAALAAATRNVGIVLAPALLVEAIHQHTEGRPLLPRLIAACTIPLGTLAVLAYWANRVGDWLAPIDRQANWQRQASWPWSTLLDGTRLAFRLVGQTEGSYWMVDWLIVVPMLAASAVALVRFRPSYGLFLWGGLLIPLSFVFEPRPLMSMPRFVLPLFPAFWGVVTVVERWRIPRWAMAAVGACGLGFLVVLSVNWYYIF